MANGQINTKSQSWIPLLNYSTKYNVSLSTLRRRIKSHTIEFKLDQGKYFILEDGEKEQTAFPIDVQPTPAPSHSKRNEAQQPNYVEASVLNSAHRLVDEIKSAYSKILQEKEEQISLLKEELSDLRMLVRILESQSETKTKAEAPEEVVPQSSTEVSEHDENFLFGEYQSRQY